MIYAQFHQKSALSDGIVEACGDRAVIVLDGRSNSLTHRALAAETCRARGYLGYQLHIGASFTRSMPLSAYTAVQPETCDHCDKSLAAGEVETCRACCADWNGAQP